MKQSKSYGISEFQNLAQLKNMCAEFDTASQKMIMIEGQQSQDFYAVWNDTEESVATIATKDYTIVQHKQLFESVVNCMSKLNLSGTGKIFNYGNRVWVDILLNNKLIKDDEKGIKIGFRFTNSYDKAQRIMCDFYGLRLVCSNGMVMRAWGSEMSRLHVGEFDVEKLVAEMITTVINKYDEAKRVIEASIIDSLEWEYVDKLLTKLFKERSRHFEEIKKRVDAIVKEKGNITRWELYNVVTAYATHGTGEKLLSTGVEKWTQERAEKILLKEVKV